MKIEYASLPNRIKAAFIDAVVIIAMMYAATEIFNLFEAVPNYAKIIAAISIFILYEPIFVSFFGCTIGHSRSHLLVRKESDPYKHITFSTALVRFILKALLGWVSLLTVTGNQKKQAIHDNFAKSIVIEEQE